MKPAEQVSGFDRYHSKNCVENKHCARNRRVCCVKNSLSIFEPVQCTHAVAVPLHVSGFSGHTSRVACGIMCTRVVC